MTALRIAIIGCGKIADEHVSAIRRIPLANITGVCDREELMARQLAERHSIEYYCDDPAELLARARPTVVHITTPPASHLALSLQCLQAGAHVYVEKPFTLNTREAVRLLDAADQSSLKVTVGHNLQFTWESIEARRLVRAGFLGGPPVHIESHYTYDLGDTGYAKGLLGDRSHWVRQLPGGLLQNLISHGIARLAEFMEADEPFVSAFGHSSPLLCRIGYTDILDELRVHVCDDRKMTGSFVFSSQIRPALNGYKLYGPSNSISVDHVHRTMVRQPDRRYKTYLNHFLPPLESAGEHLRNFGHNVWRFLGSRFHDDSGLKNLIEAFYRAVSDNQPLPIAYSQILLTSRIMDAIFAQIQSLPSPIAGSGVPPWSAGASGRADMCGADVSGPDQSSPLWTTE